MAADKDDQESLRVLMAEFRGEMRTSLADLRGDLRVVHEQTSTLATKVENLETRMETINTAQDGFVSKFVSKKEVDRKLRNGTAIIGTFLTVLTLFINTLLAVVNN